MDEVDDMADELDLSEDERQDVYDAFEWADADDNGGVDYGEWSMAIETAIEHEPSLQWEILDGFADFADEYDVDCDDDGVEGCADERAGFRDEVAAMVEE